MTLFYGTNFQLFKNPKKNFQINPSMTNDTLMADLMKVIADWEREREWDAMLDVVSPRKPTIFDKPDCRPEFSKSLGPKSLIPDLLNSYEPWTGHEQVSYRD